MVWSSGGGFGLCAEWAAVFVGVLLLSFPSLASPGGFGDAQDAEARVLDVVVPGLLDRVALRPDDPRTPELQAGAPEAAEGLWVGHLEGTGWKVHLVDRGELTLGVLAVPGATQWVTLEAGRLVPFTPDPAEPRRLAPPLEPQEASTGHPVQETASSLDGVLQIALEGDSMFHRAWGEDWDQVQLAIIHLVGAVYEAEIGFPFEVVDQRVWEEGDPAPYESFQLCTNTEHDVLPRYREHSESRSRTMEDVRELSHLFTGRFSGGPTIGCAYIGALDSSFAYGVSSVADPVMKNNNLYRNVVLVSHEIGHNFGGHHHRALGENCHASTIMHPILCTNAPVFSGVETLTVCRSEAGVCPVLIDGNAHRMWDHAKDRI